jgi:hypothetical protein
MNSKIFENTFEKHRRLALNNKTSSLEEIFLIDKKSKFRENLIRFLQSEFSNGNLQAKHVGISATDYKPNDWCEPIADTIINNLAEYFEKIRGQTEKDLESEIPIVRDENEE